MTVPATGIVRRPADAYLAQLRALLPTGPAWPDGPGTVWDRVLTPLAATLGDLDGRAADLAGEADPRATLELLAEWERDCGLPDSCSGPAVGIEARRREVIGALTGRPGGQSRAFFIALATAYGFTVTITEFDPHTCEHACEHPVYDAPWRFTWRLNAPAETIGELTCASDCETPLRWWGNRLLECVIRRRKPAHTTVLFGYA